MPVDPNEAPEGFYAVASLSCDGCDLSKNGYCHPRPPNAFCGSMIRKDCEFVIFKKKPQPTETKPMEDEYEYIVADSVVNCKAIVEWMFSCGTQVKSELDEGYSYSNVSLLEIGRTYRRKKPQPDVLLTDPEEIMRGIAAGVVLICGVASRDEWEPLSKHVDEIKSLQSKGYKYRLKPGCKLPANKVKKLVPRTPEDFWPLIGRWWCRHKKDNFRSIIQSDRLSCQDEWEIAPLGTEDWQPMMILKEVEVAT